VRSDIPGQGRHCSSPCWHSFSFSSGGSFEQRRIRERDRVKSYVVPFFVALLACATLFLLLDLGVMNLMGLTLFFNP